MQVIPQGADDWLPVVAAVSVNQVKVEVHISGNGIVKVNGNHAGGGRVRHHILVNHEIR